MFNGRSLAVVVYLAAMIALIVALDVLVFQGYFWARLLSNIGIVLVFAGFYLRYLGR